MRELKASGEPSITLEVSEESERGLTVVPVSISGGAAEEWLVMFKNETHNSPDRDRALRWCGDLPGRSHPRSAFGRSYGLSGHARNQMPATATPSPRSPPGKLLQKKICQIAAHGYSSYGNQIGLSDGSGLGSLSPRLCGEAHGDRRGGLGGSGVRRFRARRLRAM